MSNKEIKNKRIKLFDLFKGNISTRAAVNLINQKMCPDSDKVILDFSKIEFISRSFTHELLRFIEKDDREIQMVNTAPSIKAMLEMVKTSKKKASKKIDQTTTIKLSEIASPF